MAIINTASCCLNPPSKPTQLLPWHKNEKWRRQCVVSIGCVIIGLQMGGGFEEGGGGNGGVAIAREIVPHQAPRWSDKRMCPPWRLNSLETIVPENLPRPSARRRLETIRYSSKTAPLLVQGSSNCFSM